jgi:hypothetical protein
VSVEGVVNSNGCIRTVSGFNNRTTDSPATVSVDE